MFLNHYCIYTYQLTYIVWFILLIGIRIYLNSYFRKIELNTTSTYSLAMTRVCATADIKEEKSTSWLSCKFPIASSRVLTTMFHMPIWINKQFILMVTSEALIHAACFVLFMSIKGMLIFDYYRSKSSWNINNTIPPSYYMLYKDIRVNCNFIQVILWHYS